MNDRPALHFVRTLRAGRRGFTLVESMVVVGIAAVLATIAYPTLEGHVLRARRADALVALMNAQLDAGALSLQPQQLRRPGRDGPARHIGRGLLHPASDLEHARRLRGPGERHRTPGTRRRVPAPAARVARRLGDFRVRRRQHDEQSGRRQPQVLEPVMRRRSLGLSMIELLVGTAIGLIVAAAAAAVVLANVRENRQLQVEARLMQELRSTAGMVARDLRRAGYWSASASGVRGDAASAPLLNPHRALSPQGAASDAVRSASRAKPATTWRSTTTSSSDFACATARSKSSSARPTGRPSAMPGPCGSRPSTWCRGSSSSTCRPSASAPVPPEARPARRGSRCAASLSRSKPGRSSIRRWCARSGARSVSETMPSSAVARSSPMRSSFLPRRVSAAPRRCS